MVGHRTDVPITSYFNRFCLSQPSYTLLILIRARTRARGEEYDFLKLQWKNRYTLE